MARAGMVSPLAGAAHLGAGTVTLVSSGRHTNERSAALTWGVCFALVTALACEEPRPSEVLSRSDAGFEPPSPPPPPPVLDCRTSESHQDADRDGYSPDEGDCDDCDPRVNPGALDVPENGRDEDCNGEDALPSLPCDGPLEATSTDARDAARALDLCEERGEALGEWGLVSARFRRYNGTSRLESPLQIWLPERFGGVTPRFGSRLFVMSTGVARDAQDAAYTRTCDAFRSRRMEPEGLWSHGAEPPDGYPRDSSQCPTGIDSTQALAYNYVELELKVRAPTNAHSLSFDSMFFTYEYPDYVCSEFNDFFVVLVDGKNVLFDSHGDNVGVNTALLSVCRPSERPLRPIACEQGPALLLGTGFDQGESVCGQSGSDLEDIGGASTGWLHTTVPVKPGRTLSLRFVLWDSGDPLLDSTVLVDNLQFAVEPAKEPSTRPITGGP